MTNDRTHILSFFSDCPSKFQKKYTSNQDSFGIDGDLLVRLFKMLENELIFHLYDLLSVLIY